MKHVNDLHLIIGNTIADTKVVINGKEAVVTHLKIEVEPDAMTEVTMTFPTFQGEISGQLLVNTKNMKILSEEIKKKTDEVYKNAKKIDL